jgi:hypothetical protein
MRRLGYEPARIPFGATGRLRATLVDYPPAAGRFLARAARDAIGTGRLARAIGQRTGVAS